MSATAAVDPIPEACAQGEESGGVLRSFRISQVRANPFRDTAAYPVPEADIQKLIASYEATDYWPNIIGRINDRGEPEIAYGHARLEALRRMRGEEGEITIIIQERSLGEMLQMLMDENMRRAERGAANEQEAVEATVRAYARGLIELPEVDPKTPHAARRYAPSFVLGGSDVSEAPRRHLYTVGTVAEYLGWPRDNVEPVLAALELIERGLVERQHYRTLSTWHAKKVTEQLRKVVKLRLDQMKGAEKRAAEAHKRATNAETNAERRIAELERDHALGLAEGRRVSAASDANFVAAELVDRLSGENGISARDIPTVAQGLFSHDKLLEDALCTQDEEESDDVSEERGPPDPETIRSARQVEQAFEACYLIDEAYEDIWAGRKKFKPYEVGNFLGLLEQHASRVADLRKFFGDGAS